MQILILSNLAFYIHILFEEGQDVLNLRDLVVSGGSHVTSRPAAAQVVLVTGREELGNLGIGFKFAVFPVGLTWSKVEEA